MNKCELYIGIDTGVNTGIAVWDPVMQKFISIQTVRIHVAMDIVKIYAEVGCSMMVRVEDARLRKWFGKADREKLQGVGSVKRDADIWEDFLTDLGVGFELVAPKNNTTKMNADYFAKLTKWKGKTTEHARDAAMLVFMK